MKKLMMYALIVFVAAGLSAEAKKDNSEGKKGKPDTEMKQAEGNEQAEAVKEKAEKKSEEAMDKGRSEEMKKATAEKKEAQKAAKESGEKTDKEQKSWWKFWK